VYSTSVTRKEGIRSVRLGRPGETADLPVAWHNEAQEGAADGAARGLRRFGPTAKGRSPAGSAATCRQIHGSVATRDLNNSVFFFERLDIWLSVVWRMGCRSVGKIYQLKRRPTCDCVAYRRAKKNKQFDSLYGGLYIIVVYFNCQNKPRR